MKILKLPWLSHKEGRRSYEIYTIDVSIDGERVATGGLDGKIRIWSIDNVLIFAQPKTAWPVNDQFLKKPLASMSRHTGSVTALKFSSDGKYLASGSDDKILLIWEKEEGAVQPVIGMECESERWSVRRRLVAHDNDIQDICWAPDSSILVTVGLDRSIIVWSGATFENIKRFDVHQSHVKGVVFDPANKYFATASDDRTVRIFRYHKGADMSFTIEHIITEPFQNSPLTTYFRRLSWSPDGQHIAVPNATNGPVSTVAIIRRGNWDTSVSLVGHDQPTEVACFNPRLFEYLDDTITEDETENANTDDKKMMKQKRNYDRVNSVIATAGQDKTIAIWNTNNPRPLVVAYDISTKAITDMSWTANGKALFLTSLDGQIIVLVFEKHELGRPIPLKQNADHLYRYGADKDSLIFPESVMQLKLEDEVRKSKKSSFELNKSSENSVGAVQEPNILQIRPKKDSKESTKIQPKSIDPPDKTKVIVLNKFFIQNGKKRVIPKLISGGYSSTPVTFELRAAIDSNSVNKKNKKKVVEHPLLGKISRPSYAIPRLGVHTLLMGMRERDQERFYIEDQSDENDYDMLEDDYMKLKHNLTLNSKTSIEKVQRDEPNTKFLEYSGVFPDTDVVVCEFGDIDDLFVLEVRNGVERAIQFDTDALFDNPTRIMGYHNGERTLEVFITDVVIACVGSERCKCWALATANGAIYFYGLSGQLKIPRILIGHKIIKIVSWNQYFIALTDSYMFYIWDLEDLKLISKEISALSILLVQQPIQNRFRPTKRIIDFSLESESLKLIVKLNDNSTYIWDKLLGCWTEPEVN